MEPVLAEELSEIHAWMSTKLKEWRGVEVQIAVTGSAGAGKSTFINMMREREGDMDWTDRACEAGKSTFINKLWELEGDMDWTDRACEAGMGTFIKESLEPGGWVVITGSKSAGMSIFKKLLEPGAGKSTSKNKSLEPKEKRKRKGPEEAKSSLRNKIRELEEKRKRKGPEEADRNFAYKRERLISGLYSAEASGKSGAVKLKMEHCAKLSLRNKWNVTVKVCVQDSKTNQKKKRWINIKELYPDAIVEMSKNSVEVTLNSPKGNHQFAVFGTPDAIDKKRMQLGLFGEKPVIGKDWKIVPILFDDTVMAYQHVCKAEKARGRQLLTTLVGLFVSNSDQDIEISFRGVELGWKIKDGKTKIIRSKDAWNSPENCTDFPRCFIEISHEDIEKRSFTFTLIVSHEHDCAETEVIAYYEDPVKHQDAINVSPITQWDEEVVVFFQVFALIMCFIGTAFKPGTH